MKNFVNAMDKESSWFVFLQKFLPISMDKVKAGIIYGSVIRKLMKEPMFDEALSEAELSTRQSPT